MRGETHIFYEVRKSFYKICNSIFIVFMEFYSQETSLSILGLLNNHFMQVFLTKEILWSSELFLSSQILFLYNSIRNCINKINVPLTIIIINEWIYGYICTWFWILPNNLNIIKPFLSHVSIVQQFPVSTTTLPFRDAVSKTSFCLSRSPPSFSISFRLFRLLEAAISGPMLPGSDIYIASL